MIQLTSQFTAKHMKRIFWVSLLLCGYVWSVTTGRDRFILEQGKKFFQVFVAWFDDAEIDFQVKQDVSKKKRPRRWD